MSAIITKTGNVVSNNRVVIWKGIIGTLIVGGSSLTAVLSGNDWTSMSPASHILGITAIIIACLKNIESLLADTTTYATPTNLPVKPAEPPTPEQTAAAVAIVEQQQPPVTKLPSQTYK